MPIPKVVYAVSWLISKSRQLQNLKRRANLESENTWVTVYKDIQSIFLKEEHLSSIPLTESASVIL